MVYVAMVSFIVIREFRSMTWGLGFFFFFSSRRRHTRSLCDWSSDVCSSDLPGHPEACRLTETLLTELVGLPVHEHCDRSGKLQCRFTVQSNRLPPMSCRI